ncbi:hypothetical protein I8D64_09935 [Brachybacterium sp. MASK1Z-5]|uniref:Uncharacterized protein n=1 Tax=Brachybacterium halotolerans TaxID=2795215 RepID=A0ABS1BAP2_9MICO|nr:hypothetical protein [Brachybacterium halotolerans]MBK0331723.1 hypothetical protein [Brachybacterium halotolerans]
MFFDDLLRRFRHDSAPHRDGPAPRPATSGTSRTGRTDRPGTRRRVPSTATAQPDHGEDEGRAREGRDMSTHLITYRPLDADLGDPGALEELQRIRAERRAEDRRRQHLAEAALRHDRIRQEHRRAAGRHRASPRHHLLQPA